MSEWKELKLKDLVDVDPEQLPSSTDADYTFFYIDISSVSSGNIDYPTHSIRYKDAPSRARKTLKDSDILMSTVRPNLKAFAQFKKKSKFNFIASTGFAVLRSKPNVNIGFIYHSLFSNSIEKQIETLVVGSNYPAINSSDVRNLKINIPSLTNQGRIAHILSTCDTLISQTQSAIAKYKAIKQGLLHDLFTRGLDATGRLRPTCREAPELYKASELGMIPRKWEVKRIEDCTKYVDYRGKTPPKSDTGILLVTAKNIRFGYIDYEISKEYIFESAFETAMSRGKAVIGDVLITTEAPMGNVAQIDKEGIALAQRVIKYQGYPNELNNDFLKLALMSDGFQKALMSEATGSTALGIKGSRLHKLKIIIPQIEEQKEIAKRVKIIDDKLKSEETLLQKYQSIKRGLMGDLLGGKVGLGFGGLKDDQD